MDEFLRYVVQRLVRNSDEVVISRREEEGKSTYLLSMPKPEVGRLIGRGGSTIKAIRALVSASAARHGGKAAVEIVE